MPTIRKVLDLSTCHLPQATCDELSSIEGVIAYELQEYGWLLWVPANLEVPDNEVDDEHVRAIQVYARGHDCDYILLDRDGPENEDLPTWDW